MKWMSDLEQELVFLGLIGMIDPPREEAKQAVARAQSAGIRPMMITGDHPKTAAVIAAELGIADRRARRHRRRAGEDVGRRARSNGPGGFGLRARQSRTQAAHRQGAATRRRDRGDDRRRRQRRARAEDRRHRRRDGHHGTDVSKEAADMVLTDDNFATIVAAVEEGRAIFANIRKFLRYLLSSNIGEVMTMFFGVLLAKVIGLHARRRRRRAAAAGHADSVDQSGDRRRARAGAGR